MDINIAVTLSGNIFRYYTQILIASVLLKANPNDNYTFYVLSDRLTKQNRKSYLQLRKIRDCDFNFIEVNDKDFQDKKPVPSIFYRLKLPSLLSNIDKVLYLDGDTLCLIDIAELYKYNVTRYYYAAVEDIFGEYWAEEVGVDYKKNEIYVNSGVLLMNLKKMRKDKIESKLIEVMHEYPDMAFYDQGIFNMVCKEKVLSLPIKYNFMPFDGKGMIIMGHYQIYYRRRFFEYQETFRDPGILHLQSKPLQHPGSLYAGKWFSVKNLVDEIHSIRE